MGTNQYKIHFMKKKTSKLNSKIFLNINLRSLLVLFFIIVSQFPFIKKNTLPLQAKDIDIEYLNKNISENDYILGIGDLIQISLSENINELTKNYKIDSAGTIYLPNIGRVYIKDLTINELTKLLKEKYLEFIIDPKPEILVIGYRPVRILIEGEIENPGYFTLPGSFKNDILNENNFQLRNTNDMDLNYGISESNIIKGNPNNKLTNPSLDYFPTVFDALQYAGGVTAYSNLSNIEIIRKNNISDGGGRKMASINFLSFINGLDLEQNARIYDGDVIKIERSEQQLMGQLSKAIKSNLNPKYINVSVTGVVPIPGIIKASKKSTLNDAIQMAGGVLALKGPIYFTRFNDDGSVDTRKFNYRRSRKRGSYKNPYLKNGDIINVGRSSISVVNEVLKGISSPIMSIYALDQLLNN